MKVLLWSMFIVPITALSLGDLVAQPVLIDGPVWPANSEGAQQPFQERPAEATTASSTVVQITLTSEATTSTTMTTERHASSTTKVQEYDQRAPRRENASPSAEVAVFLHTLFVHAQAAWTAISPVQPHCYIALAAILLALGNCVCVCICLNCRRRQSEYLLPIVSQEPPVKLPEFSMAEPELPPPPLPEPVETVECCATCKTPYRGSLVSLRG